MIGTTHLYAVAFASMQLYHFKSHGYYIDKFHSKLVHSKVITVGLAQACPNNFSDHLQLHYSYIEHARDQETTVICIGDITAKKSWVDLTYIRLLELQFCDLHTSNPCWIWCCSYAITQYNIY